jgi:C-terminal processing protease CtpA/Prc
VSRIHALSLLAVLLAGCGAGGPIPTQVPQLPGDYLINALDWVEANYVKGDAVDWASLRRQAMALRPDPQTTAEAHPALQYVTEQLGDGVTFFLSPDERKQQGDYGLSALYPDAVILGVDPGGPAERAGLRAGDQIETVSGAPPRAWHATQFLDFGNDAAISLTVLRAGEPQPISVTLQKTTANRQSQPTGRRFTLGHASIGYIELPVESGAGQRYPTLAQKVLREADQAAACGWIVDVRRNAGGDIWSYLAAIGPILGEGDAGGFVYRDGTREPWTYRDGKVFWNGNERDESLVEGPVYRPKRAAPPVALLTSRDTDAAGELLVVAFRGRPQVRSFGEPTGGAPFLSFHTDLSDGAFLAVSGAYAVDRTGRTYDGPIPPDERVATDWTRLGTEQDPVVQAALTWLQGQSGCAL